MLERDFVFLRCLAAIMRMEEKRGKRGRRTHFLLPGYFDWRKRGGGVLKKNVFHLISEM